MEGNEIVLNKIAEALLLDYTDVFYVCAKCDAYKRFSVDTETRTLHEVEGGENFFADLIRESERIIHEEDKHIFQQDLQKEQLLSILKKGSMQSKDYRMMIDGKPVWHSLRLIRGLDGAEDYFILGVMNIDERMRWQKEQEKLALSNDTYTQIASKLAERYNTIFYVNMLDDSYIEISSTNIYRILDVPATGHDFYQESKDNAMRIIHEEDRENFLYHVTKENIISMLRKKSLLQVDYRILVQDSVLYARMSIMYTKDKNHLMFCVEDRQEEMEMEESLREERERSITYNHIANSLAVRYDSIYYVDVNTDEYSEYSTSEEYKRLHIHASGHNFFDECVENIQKIIYPEDREQVYDSLRKENLLHHMEQEAGFYMNYRLIMDEKPVYMNLRVVWAEDHQHLIIGLQNIDAQIRKENEQKRALKQANERANKDELTGVRNKNAFQDYEQSLQGMIENKTCHPFAIAICDLNNLKMINDTLGHKMGDNYIQESCQLICGIFKHSPVFRVGGDEFAVILSGRDYIHRRALIKDFKERVRKNLEIGNKVVVAIGCAEYQAKKDRKVSGIFERADGLMYKNKKELKQIS